MLKKTLGALLGLDEKAERVLCALACIALASCNTVELKPRPARPDGGCPSTPVAYCDAAAPPACFGGAGNVPGDGGYPAACTVYLPDPTPDDFGTCTLFTACTCNVRTDASTGTWSCGR